MSEEGPDDKTDMTVPRVGTPKAERYLTEALVRGAPGLVPATSEESLVQIQEVEARYRPSGRHHRENTCRGISRTKTNGHTYPVTLPRPAPRSYPYRPCIALLQKLPISYD